MFHKYEWYEHSKMWIGNCPPIPEYRCNLGTDKEGKRWVCACKYREQERKFLVAFDYETDDWSAFLREEVLDAPNYWRAHQEIYHSKLVNYEQIQHVVEAFVEAQGIEGEAK